MSKRFTDSDKWKNQWFRTLPPNYKLLWLYILDNCDHAGIWRVDFELAEFQISLPFNAAEALELFGDRIHVFKSGCKWLIFSYIEFQYNTRELKEGVSVQKSVIKLLEANDLLEIYTKYSARVTEHLPNTYTSVKDKDKDKDKDKEGDARGNQGASNTGTRFTPPTLDEVRTYATELGIPDEAEAFYDRNQTVGWKSGKNPMKDWKSALRTWKRNQEKWNPPIPTDPTLAEVKKHFADKGWGIEQAVTFSARYTSTGWVDGTGQKITNWRAKAAEWMIKQKS